MIHWRTLRQTKWCGDRKNGVKREFYVDKNVGASTGKGMGGGFSSKSITSGAWQQLQQHLARAAAPETGANVKRVCGVNTCESSRDSSSIWREQYLTSTCTPTSTCNSTTSKSTCTSTEHQHL